MCQVALGLKTVGMETISWGGDGVVIYSPCQSLETNLINSLIVKQSVQAAVAQYNFIYQTECVLLFVANWKVLHALMLQGTGLLQRHDNILIFELRWRSVNLAVSRVVNET